MKRALYHTLVKSHFAGNFSVMTVTSEKVNQLYGRNVYGNPTHCRRDQTYGKFPTESDATRMIDLISAVYENYREKLIEADKVTRALMREREGAINKLIDEQSRVVPISKAG